MSLFDGDVFFPGPNQVRGYPSLLAMDRHVLCSGEEPQAERKPSGMVRQFPFNNPHTELVADKMQRRPVFDVSDTESEVVLHFKNPPEYVLPDGIYISTYNPMPESFWSPFGSDVTSSKKWVYQCPMCKEDGDHFSVYDMANRALSLVVCPDTWVVRTADLSTLVGYNLSYEDVRSLITLSKPDTGPVDYKHDPFLDEEV